MNRIVAVCEKSFLENSAFIGTVAVPIIAIVAGAIAIWQVISNAKSQRRSAAYASYHQYLTLCMENPNLAFGVQGNIVTNLDEYAKYKWFIATMLLCFEEILISCPREKDWTATINSQLRRHVWFLSKSSSVSSGHWKSELHNLIKDQERIVESQNLASRDAVKEHGEICFKLNS